MPRLHYPLSLSLVLACGPLAPPSDNASSTADAASTTTATTTPPAPTTVTTLLPTTTANLDTTGIATTGNESTTTGTFIITPDGGGDSTIECDTFAQDCPPGQKCVPWAEGGGGAWNATKCVDVTGDGAPGDPCFAPEGGVAGIDDCAFGSICWDVDQTFHGTCVRQCMGTPDAPICPQKFFCVITAEGAINLCLPNCDPLLQDCPGGDLCLPHLDDSGFQCVLDVSGDLGQANDPCEFANACDKGLLCIDALDASSACDPRSPGCCQPFCQLSDPTCPNPDQQCVALFDPKRPDLPPDYKDIGTCRIPP